MRLKNVLFSLIFLITVLSPLHAKNAKIKDVTFKITHDTVLFEFRIDGKFNYEILRTYPRRFLINFYRAELRSKVKKKLQTFRSSDFTSVEIHQIERCPNCVIRFTVRTRDPLEQWEVQPKRTKKGISFTFRHKPSEKGRQWTLTPYTFEYKLGPGDLLDIRILELPDVTLSVRVDPDGKISVPPLGRINADGKTIGELEDELVNLLKKSFIKSPHVSINIKEYHSQRYIVMGAVNSPGAFPFIQPTTLLRAIAEAGGVIENHGSIVYVFRKKEDGTYERIEIDLEALISSGDLTKNLWLIPGDIITVPFEEVKVYVFGAVTNPGIIRGSYPMTVLRAIAAAGGPNERASLGGVRLIQKDGKVLKINVDDIIKGKKKDVLLLSGDVLYVPESLF